MQEKIWEFKSAKLKREDIADFAERIHVPAVIAVILMNRGINTEKKAASYFKKSLEGVHNPFLLKDMEAAAERILAAVDGREKITVYGDYDVDGITSTTVLYKFLKSIGADVSYYIPDRFREGYGLNVIAINRIARGGTSLLITVDCGISSVGEVELAKTLGLDVIITDHHSCREELPRALAVINPKRPDSEYPFDALAGVGVAFKLVLALAMRLGKSTRDIFFEYAELAALGTIADVVPLIDENRVIADKGLAAMAHTKYPGISALLSAAGADGKAPDSTAAAFMLAPRINAAGRMEHAKIAAELLMDTNPKRAAETAVLLNDLNNRRRAVELEIYRDAMAQAAAFEKEQYVYVLSGEGWHSGVIGIVASRICEQLYRPCILIALDGGKGKGSGRSIEELNLFDAVSDSEELLTAYGGHAQAAGLSIDSDRIDEFRTKINAYAKKQLENRRLIPKIGIDCRLSPESMTMAAARMTARLEPFGEGNEEPVFAAEQLKVMDAAKIGSEGRHLRLRLTAGSMSFTAVGFGMGDFEVQAGDYVSVAFNLSINNFQGNESLQLLLKDIKKCG